MVFIADPKIVYGQTTYTLDNPVVEYDWNESDYILHESIITGYLTIEERGERARAKIRALGVTWAKYVGYRLFAGKVVTFYPYGTDRLTIGQTEYNPPSFTAIVLQVKPYHSGGLIGTYNVLIDLVSQGYYTLTMTPYVPV